MITFFTVSPNCCRKNKEKENKDISFKKVNYVTLAPIKDTQAKDEHNLVSN